ncbi:Aerobic cobaltochelatase subunit CobN [Sinobacterium norvegicum]|uniref:Cobaltochelatase subunit CobN n=1 Tax=Sinobacterium norvegicum TaxID=1641715 RepID=A0ABN8EQ21_9GAMM|nr:cobaltochelatase subunit CobN [Sinobacterium norvegicum]CAH0993387.1 Aerobic cobaltochelatase subunit CobN [Sinobacterium norvegicum]
MHLLAAQPGGFVDDEGIVDLQQQPAPIVILSAADSSLAALAQAVDTLPRDFAEVRLANWMQLLKPAAMDLYRDTVIDAAEIVVVSLLGGESYWQYGVEQLQQWQQQRPNRHLIVVPGDDAVDLALLAISSVDEGRWLTTWQYLRQGGVSNAKQCLLSLLPLLQGGAVTEVSPPLQIPSSCIYWPVQYADGQIALEQLTEDVLLAQCQQHWQPMQPVAILLFYRSHLQSANTAMFDQLIALMIEQGLNPLPIAITSLKDQDSIDSVNRLIEQTDSAVIINTTGFASNRVGTPCLSSEPTAFVSPFTANITVLQCILSSSTEDDWLQYKQGLRSRDVAMQVVLPELDGRIITHAISFKALSHYNQRCQIDVIRYQLQQQRAVALLQLAANICRLSTVPNQQKRVALILANYPTKDGRIGNGVGLDTPASTVNILQALASAGYPISNIPADGNDLITELMGSVTNNPNTIHQRGCWQSMSVADYRQYFQQLPLPQQQAVIERWGEPEQDPKYRNGRIMLAGIRLGETFVGIQPARGYNLDLAANYHDPDLIPPHSYLAFYFWLRYQYRVAAVIHVGKHGNLEWLPGKGTALSAHCWPDITLGPIPHFYPFIVNDPGEGAQAKRRAHAVIIDHLMPPMTRAESYGELAALEGLVDEYYQTLGMDGRREQWLREQIIIEVKRCHLAEELAADDDDEMLDQLDAYLCDIKEAQIRHGLHRLGQLPVSEKLVDTIVALLRLPRGDDDHSRGILHSLAKDLDLTVLAGEDYDPLTAEAQVWTAERPAILQHLSDESWRTAADTRERLELLAMIVVKAWVIEEGDSRVDLQSLLPASYALCQYSKQTLLAALEQSAVNETEALINGLGGGFVEPGPSGAPTRGRLDTLPTGRNFFSVDNRSIPSNAAWALGQLSAQALIERHLQEHGDYPTTLGLSVWGTATMRTGGDDIAQAFALMGVKPIWAPGSQRVIDIEVIPAMLLGRPRVDVTLRVSGFFRDAFANVMRLFAVAVEAIAKMDEADASNPIKANIERRRQQLIAEGVEAEAAQTQACYRVFGSKPGAYGAGLQGLIDERCWQHKSDLSEAYINWGGYAYGSDYGGVAGGDGVEARSAFGHQLANLEAVVQNQDNREHDLLDSDDYYQFQGGMTNAVTVLSGNTPKVYHSDHANPSAPKIRTLKEELNRVIRSRLLNPKWIEGMREHGYKGGFEMAASIDYMFAYDATTDLIADYQYQQVSDTLIFDRQNQQFLKDNNPQALEEMTERMLEACQRGLWQQPDDYQQKLQGLLLSLDEENEG